MSKYLVMTVRNPTFQAEVLDAHYAFLTELRKANKLELAGPFTGGSGGGYLLNVSSMEEARAIAFSDPVHLTDSSTVTVYEWNAK